MEMQPSQNPELKDKSRPLIDALFEDAATMSTDGVRAVEVSRAETYPLRCRAVIFDQSAERILVIRRKRPDQASYAVFPGGGLEEEDATPLDGVKRELQEELSISSSDISIDDTRVIELTNDNQWVYFATSVTNDLEPSAIGGPEADRDVSVSGTYEPTWISLNDLEAENVVPAQLRAIIQKAYTATTGV